MLVENIILYFINFVSYANSHQNFNMLHMYFDTFIRKLIVKNSTTAVRNLVHLAENKVFFLSV